MCTTFRLSEIEPGVFVGNLAAATNINLLKRSGITHILIAGVEMTKYFPEDIVYK
jgi:atypical dual specificity phosphatase